MGVAPSGRPGTARVVLGRAWADASARVLAQPSVLVGSCRPDRIWSKHGRAWAVRGCAAQMTIYIGDSSDGCTKQ